MSWFGLKGFQFKKKSKVKRTQYYKLYSLVALVKEAGPLHNGYGPHLIEAKFSHIDINW